MKDVARSVGPEISVLKGEDVRSIRYKLGQSQSEFALMIGVSLSTLQGWEDGRHHPDGPALALCVSRRRIRRSSQRHSATESIDASHRRALSYVRPQICVNGGVPMRRSLSLVFLVLLLPVIAFAQSQATTGAIEGTATDATGGVLPGVTVTLHNTATNFAQVQVTTAQGGYHGVLLPLGGDHTR